MITEPTISRFIRLELNKEVLDAVQIALYVTICKILEPELKKIRSRVNF